MAKKEAIVSLSEYANMVEKMAQPLAVVQITHPEAVTGDIHQGTYAGIRLVKADTASALLSSGEII